MCHYFYWWIIMSTQNNMYARCSACISRRRHFELYLFVLVSVKWRKRSVFISQLIRYARACSSYECFILRARRLSSKLLKQGYLVERLKSSFRKFYGRYGSYWAIWSNPVTNVKWHSDPWPTVTSLPIRLPTNCMTFIPSLTFTE